MKIVQVQFFSWDKAYNFDAHNITLVKGDKVIVSTEMGMDIGDIVSLETPKDLGDTKEIKPIIRKATAEDLEKISDETIKNNALEVCRHTSERLGLAMKVVDVHLSFDGNRATFFFVSDGRVDFRELVRELTRSLGRAIRMQQIGIRDETKINGDCGKCGRGLCCKGFLHELNSVTSDMAEVQQCNHRGSDRLSGVCGRLMCCLAYEVEGYQSLLKNMPAIGATVKVDGRRGTVVGHNTLKQSVNVEFPPDKEGERRIVLEIDLNRHKKKD